MGKAITKTGLLKLTDLPRELVTLPGGLGECWVRGMTAEERDAYEQSCMKRDGKGNFRPDLVGARAKLVVRTACDEDGQLLFDPGDVAAVGRIRGDVIEAIMPAASRLSGITEADLAELEGNSEET